MTRNVKNLGALLLVLLLNVGVFASEAMEASEDYVTDYYDDEGSLVFKARIGGVSAQGKQKKFPAPTVSDPVAVGHLVRNGYGADVAVDIFFNRYIAAELSLGVDLLRTKYSALYNVSHNYGVNNNLGKHKDLFMIPLTVIAQWHPAPFGGVDCYLGSGYSGSYLFTKSKAFNIKNAHGAVLQAGVDFYAKDDTLINLDVKQFFLEPKVTYKANVVGNKAVTSKAKLNPLVVSVGIGFKF